MSQSLSDLAIRSRFRRVYLREIVPSGPRTAEETAEVLQLAQGVADGAAGERPRLFCFLGFDRNALDCDSTTIIYASLSTSPVQGCSDEDVLSSWIAPDAIIPFTRVQFGRTITDLIPGGHVSPSDVSCKYGEAEGTWFQVMCKNVGPGVKPRSYALIHLAPNVAQSIADDASTAGRAIAAALTACGAGAAGLWVQIAAFLIEVGYERCKNSDGSFDLIFRYAGAKVKSDRYPSELPTGVPGELCGRLINDL